MTEPQLLSVDERAALRQCCLRYWTHTPRDSWNITVSDSTRPVFEALRDYGYIDLHGDVAALRPEKTNACAYILALNE